MLSRVDSLECDWSELSEWQWWAMTQMTTHDYKDIQMTAMVMSIRIPRILECLWSHLWWCVSEEKALWVSEWKASVEKSPRKRLRWCWMHLEKASYWHCQRTWESFILTLPENMRKLHIGFSCDQMLKKERERRKISQRFGKIDPTSWLASRKLK